MRSSPGQGTEIVLELAALMSHLAGNVDVVRDENTCLLGIDAATAPAEQENVVHPSSITPNETAV